MVSSVPFEDHELDWMIWELNRQRRSLINLAEILSASEPSCHANAARYSATRIGHVLNRLYAKETRYRLTAKGRAALRN